MHTSMHTTLNARSALLPSVVMMSTLLSACASSRLQPADIDTLCGKPWVGTLTYLDYTSHQPVTIDSSFLATRVDDAPPAWEFGYGYSKEPHADSKETVTLAADGRMLGEERVVSRATFPGGVRFVTQQSGMDDGRPATFRFEHAISAHEFSRRKLVYFTDGKPPLDLPKGMCQVPTSIVPVDDALYLERHVYRWTR